MRIFGDPVDFKGIKIHPVKMKDSDEFYSHIYCLMFEKHKIPDVRIIKMPYLDYLFILMQQEEMILYSLRKILKLTFKDQEYKFKYSDDEPISITVGDTEISGYEFENIRKFILSENGIQVDEEIINAEAEKALKESQEFKNRHDEPATLEERIVAYHCISHIDYSKIAEYSILQFSLGLQRFEIIKNFDIYSALLAENGSKDIQHWLCHIKDKGKYDDVKITQEEFDKIKSESGLTDKF